MMTLNFVCIALLVIVCMINLGESFLLSKVGSMAIRRHNSIVALQAAATPEQEAAINALKAKMSQPGYNPQQDPEYQSLMAQALPADLRDINGAIERLSVAFKDATSGVDAVTVDLDSIAATFDKKELISSPTSDWAKGGFVEDGTPYSASREEELYQKMKAKYPEAAK